MQTMQTMQLFCKKWFLISLSLGQIPIEYVSIQIRISDQIFHGFQIWYSNLNPPKLFEIPKFEQILLKNISSS